MQCKGQRRFKEQDFKGKDIWIFVCLPLAVSAPNPTNHNETCFFLYKRSCMTPCLVFVIQESVTFNQYANPSEGDLL